MEKQKVCVLMSTYCGEKFLTEQLDSIRNQKGVDVKLIVRDDGSPDGGATVRLLRNYKQSYPEFDMEIQEGANLGWAMSFMQLVYDAPEADYYAFADQDDIWLSDKLLNAANLLSELKNLPSLYFSNLYFYKVNEIKKIIRRDATDFANKYKAFMRNLATGCTVVFSPELRKLALLSQECKWFNHAHDKRLFILAAFFGKIVCDSTPRILYRQHENNEVGAKTTLLEIWKTRIKEIRQNGLTHKREECAKWLTECYDGFLSPKEKANLHKVIHYRRNLKFRIELLLSREFVLDSFQETCRNKIRLILGNF